MSDDSRRPERGIDTAPADDPECVASAEAPAASSAPADSSACTGTPPPCPSAASLPTQAGPLGIRFDFNLGIRVLLPDRPHGTWRIRLRNSTDGNVLFESQTVGELVGSAKHRFIRPRIEVWDRSDADVPAFTHDYDARDRAVLIRFPVGALGDTLAWMPYAARFAERYGARVTCAMSSLVIPILRDAYPHIRFHTHEEIIEHRLAETFYATYVLGLFFDDKDCIWQPTDIRRVGLHRTAGVILGVDLAEAPARLALPDNRRPIAEPYVCIAAQGSTQAETAGNPAGWSAVIAHLKARGLRVVCIDQGSANGAGSAWTHSPHGAEDQTGDQPPAERARWLRHAQAFIGLGSNLAWLAWSAGCPTVLIAGFTHPDQAVRMPGRVINWHACTTCWTDPGERVDHDNVPRCPRHANTPRQFECTRLVTVDAVIAATERAICATRRPPSAEAVPA